MTLLLGVFLASGFALEFGGGAAMAEERYGSMQAAPALSIQLFRDDSFWTAGVHALLPVGSPGGAQLGSRNALAVADFAQAVDHIAQSLLARFRQLVG